MKSSHIAIFASGSGSNAENIIQYFKNNPSIHFPLLLCNNSKAGVLDRAKHLKVPTFLFNKNEFKGGDVLKKLKEANTDLIILAGFLWLMPPEIVRAYPNKIINIHPALLPKYGGKGMYGMNVHNAIIENKEKESGITIHYINEEYDKGDVIFQAKCQINKGDSAEDLAKKVHALEYKHFPEVIETLL